MPHPWGMLNKNTQVPKISTFYFVKINHKNLSSYITNNKTCSSYKNKILDLEKTPFLLLLLNTWRPLLNTCSTMWLWIFCFCVLILPRREVPRVKVRSGPSTGRVRPADRPTGIVAAKYDVTIQIPTYHAPPRRTAINHSNPGTPGSYFKQYLAEAPCFPAKSRPPLPGIQLTGALGVGLVIKRSLVQFPAGALWSVLGQDS